jgi:hypothetical protein
MSTSQDNDSHRGCRRGHQVAAKTAPSFDPILDCANRSSYLTTLFSFGISWLCKSIVLDSLRAVHIVLAIHVRTIIHKLVLMPTAQGLCSSSFLAMGLTSQSLCHMKSKVRYRYIPGRPSFKCRGKSRRELSKMKECPGTFKPSIFGCHDMRSRCPQYDSR